MRSVQPAWLVIAAGVSAALHVGKLPPAVPVLRDALGVTLLEAGFLLSLVQLAGMALGLVVGAAADAIGARRTMVVGLAVLSLASALGAFATTPAALLALRAVEGLGFLLASLPAPGLVRKLVEPVALSRMLGLWGAYMPFGTALALLAGPLVMAAAGWQAWWLLLAAVSACMTLALWRFVPGSTDAPVAHTASLNAGRLRRTLRSRGPWVAALAFGAYSAQWLAVIGFLPTIYAQAGVPAGPAALATAAAAAVNMIGNIASGRLLQRGVVPHVLLLAGFAAMAAGAVLAFVPWEIAALRYAGILLFSSVGGLIPGTLFSVAVRLAPDEGTVSTTVGWMQQWSSFGQFAGPPLVAAVAARSGGWHSVWWVTIAFAAAGAVLAGLIGAQLRRPPSPRSHPHAP
jgi:CP family cyanate transporter-like MFS transporter